VGNGRMLLDKCRLETSCAFTRWQHFSAQNDLIAAIFKAWVKSKIKLLSIDVNLYLKNNRVKFHPDQI